MSAVLGRVDGAGAAWHPRHLLRAPHRLAFFLATVVLVASGLWWAAVQADRAGAGFGMGWAVSPTLLHAAVMTLGFIPLFFAGFLFTAGPRWLDLPAPSAREVLPALGAQAAGWLAWLAGGHLHLGLALLGLMAAAWGLSAATVRFLRLLLASRVPDRLHAAAIALGLVVGCAGLAGLGVCLALGLPDLALACVETALWGFVVVVYVAVAHRMIPFFTSSALPLQRVWRPGWVLGLMLGVAALQAAAVWADRLAPLSVPWLLARGTVEVAAGAVLMWLAFAWGLVQSLKVRLLAMLHLGFLWLGLGLALGGAGHLLAAATGQPALPLAALHAVTIGCLGSLMLAMVTRVSCGHSGRALVADNLVWTLFWALQLAAVARVAAAVAAWPAQGLLVMAATLWAAVMLVWGVRHASWWGRPRADGRPG